MTAPISKCPRNITFLNFLNSLISIWLISYEDMLASAFMGFCLHYNGQSKVVGPYTVARHGELQNNPLLYHLPTQVAIEIDQPPSSLHLREGRADSIFKSCFTKISCLISPPNFFWQEEEEGGNGPASGKRPAP